jgi:adenylate cyclase
MERRLVPISPADVVGYSRLMGADEAGTPIRLNQRESGLIDPLLAAHNGRGVNQWATAFRSSLPVL